MSNDFAKLRRDSSLAKLQKALENTQKQGFKQDERYWTPTVDKAGNGFAEIRFLPPPPVDGPDGNPFVVLFSHSFKGPTGQWYIENSRSTIGEKDPLGELNQALWATGVKSNQDLVRSRSRQTKYISNILVINDPAKPENNGKVFLFKYGKKIMGKINDAAGVGVPEAEYVDPSEVKFDAFNFWTGANFKLKVRRVAEFPNYDKSAFDAPSVLNEDDAALEKIWRSTYSLKAEIAPDKFKSYADLSARLSKVLGIGVKPVASNSEVANEDNEREAPTRSSRVTQTVGSSTTETVDLHEAVTATGEDDEDTFKQLAQLAEDL